MSDDKKPRITSFAFSKEIFNDPSFSSFLFENNDLMNIDLDKKSESKLNLLKVKLITYCIYYFFI